MNIEKSPVVPSNERVGLRLALILEELTELAQSTGQENLNQFRNMLLDKVKAIDESKIVGHKNLTEALDALADIDYVVNGTVLEFGLQEVFDRACNEVHSSNMTKACSSIEEAELTKLKIEKEKGFECIIVAKDSKFIVYRNSDFKLLKSINYKPANLGKFISSL